jgi:hypothetical protein
MSNENNAVKLSSLKKLPPLTTAYPSMYCMGVNRGLLLFLVISQRPIALANNRIHIDINNSIFVSEQY